MISPPPSPSDAPYPGEGLADCPGTMDQLVDAEEEGVPHLSEEEDAPVAVAPADSMGHVEAPPPDVPDTDKLSKVREAIVEFLGW